uniref:Putative ran gtpase-activating protein n=1 Tax=Ixodes ricinus TaxID=34613 RepID=A0A0K8RGZ8_IXORI
MVIMLYFGIEQSFDSIVNDNLQQLQIDLKNKNFDLLNPCTARDGKCCWIYHVVEDFNRILKSIKSGLCELIPNTFYLGFLKSGTYEFEFSEYEIFQASIIHHILLRYHKCINSLILSKYQLVQTYSNIILDALQYNESITELYLDGSDIIDHNLLLGVISKLKTLEKLSLSSMYSVKEELSSILTKNTNLRFVNLQDVSVNNALDILYERCNKLNSLILKCHINPDKLQTLENLLNQKLKLAVITNIGDNHRLSFPAINDALFLKSLEISHFVMRGSQVKFIHSLMKNTCLETLELSHCTFDYNSIRDFATALKENRVLQKVVLQFCTIPDEGAILIAESICTNNSLRTLCVKTNIFSTIGNVTLINALAHNKTLKTLNLGYISINKEINDALEKSNAHHRVHIFHDERGMHCLTNYINRYANTIVDLNVECIVFVEDEKKLENFLFALTKARNLKFLEFSTGMLMSKTATRYICQILTNTQTLKRLFIRGGLSHKYLVSIMDSLSINKTVNEFELSYPCTKKTVSSLCNMLLKNKTLTSFGHVYGDYEDIRTLSVALEKNTSIIDFRAQYTPTLGADVSSVMKTLRRNYSLMCRASLFAQNPNSYSEYAKYFDVHWNTPEFYNLMCEMTQDPLQIKKWIRNGNRFIAQNLFQLTNVCNELRTTDMIYDCWVHIFSYVRMIDIES